MDKRHLVQIPVEQVQKLVEIDSVRADLKGYPLSRKVHILLQERLKEVFKEESTVPPEELKKGKWFEYIREQIPLHTVAPVMMGIVKNSKEMIGCPFTKVLFTTDTSKIWWGNYKKDIYSVGEFLITNLQDKKFADDYYKKYKEVYIETKQFMEGLITENFGKLSKSELLEKYIAAYETFKRFMGLNMDIDSIDIYLEQKMQNKLKELLKSKTKFNQVEFNLKYSLLTTPTEMSFVNQEQIAIYKLAEKIISDNKMKELFDYDIDITLQRLKDDYPAIIIELKRLVDNYWWTCISWNTLEEKTMKTFIKDIKKIMKENPNVNGEIQRLTKFVDKVKEDKDKLSKELRFDDEMNHYLDVFEHYALFHDWRKEGQMKSVVVMNKFLFEFSRLCDQKYTDLVWCWPWEIKEFVKSGKLDIDMIKKRQESYFVITSASGIEQHYGGDAIRRRKEELEADMGSIQDFKGNIASIGKVTGKVKVCFSATDAIKKIQKGEVLVTSMTTPEYVPAMKKAAAIVTDEGGVTCHAAIISRELKIPCIVGTNVATKVLKDGDLIEVNANHGAIKILKN